MGAFYKEFLVEHLIVIVMEKLLPQYLVLKKLARHSAKPLE